MIIYHQDRNTDLEAAHNSPTPFSAAASPRLSEEQSSRPVLNGQPLGLHAEPIGLFHPVFNQFQADLNNTERFIGDAMTYDRVRYLFFAFANIYASDDERVEGIEEVMEGLLDREFTVMKKQEVSSDRVMTQSCGESKVYLVIQDVKCEFGMSDPHIQAGLTYQKYWARRKLDCPDPISFFDIVLNRGISHTPLLLPEHHTVDCRSLVVCHRWCVFCRGNHTTVDGIFVAWWKSLRSKATSFCGTTVCCT